MSLFVLKKLIQPLIYVNRRAAVQVQLVAY